MDLEGGWGKDCLAMPATSVTRKQNKIMLLQCKIKCNECCLFAVSWRPVAQNVCNTLPNKKWYQEWYCTKCVGFNYDTYGRVEAGSIIISVGSSAKLCCDTIWLEPQDAAKEHTFEQLHFHLERPSHCLFTCSKKGKSFAQIMPAYTVKRWSLDSYITCLPWEVKKKFAAFSPWII